MTFNEAEDRAELIWSNVATVNRLRVSPELWEVALDTLPGGRGLAAAVHYLDAAGRPTCHPACIAREASLGAVADA